MSGGDPGFPTLDDDQTEAPIARLGRHTIGLWLAAEEIGDPRLLSALRPLVMQIGRVLAVDLMAQSQPDDTQH
jgi:hypothetical protein